MAAEVELRPGYRIEWVGQFRDLAEALRRLAFIVPLTIGVILLLLSPTSGRSLICRLRPARCRWP